MTWCVPVETCGIYADANTPSFGTCLWLETYLK
jgi:hypothetical protein